MAGVVAVVVGDLVETGFGVVVVEGVVVEVGGMVWICRA